MKIKAIILIVVFVISGISEMNASNKKADRYYKMYKYAKAIPLYKKSVSVADEKSKKEAVEKLGDCYRLINNVQEAQSWYSRAVTYKNVNPMVFYYLGQTYMTTGQYDEAKSAFLQYAALAPSDPKGRILAQNCDSLQPLLKLPDAAEIKNLAAVNTQFSEMGPVFYKEGLLFASDRLTGIGNEATFEWTNSGFYDLYYAEPRIFGNFASDLTESQRMSKSFNQTFHDGPVSFTAGYNTAYLTRTVNAKVVKDKDNFRTNRLKVFSAPLGDGKKINFKALPLNTDEYSVGHAAISGDGRKMIFSSDMPGGYGGSDLYLTENTGGGKWSKPLNLGTAINTFGNEVFPVWMNDTTLFFSSDGLMGYGGLDIFEVHLKNGQWGKPVNMLKPLNSSYDDFGMAFVPGKKMGFFSSDRPGGKGSDDIYFFKNYQRPEPEKPKPVEKKPEVVVKPEVKVNMTCGYVLDKKSRLPLEDATVFLFKPGTGEVLVTKSDASGMYKFPVDPDTRYQAKAMKTQYFDDCLGFSYPALNPDICQPVPGALLLEKYAVNQTFTLENIFYDLGKWNIRKDAEPSLNELVRIMQQHPISIELSSHTDSRASDAFNMTLSQRRAESATTYIINHGIDQSRITAKGYGESKLVNRCANGVPCSEAEHQANRRTEFKITSIGTPEPGKDNLDLLRYRDGDKLTISQFESGFFTCSGRDQGTTSQTPAATAPPKQTVTTGATPQTTVVPASVQSVSGETYYTIQVAAAGKAGSQPSFDFKGEPGFFKEVNGVTKCFVGKFSDFKTATAEKSRLSGKFPGAFPVGFKDGNVIPLSELRKILP
ncbi:MAG TPA: OmpA family protein [Prolixibacteraceae bacterium]|nr:OmpA family protein [Prolixibacteraceae bacterium]